MRKKHIIYCILALGYILGTHNGTLALLYDGVPVQTYPCEVSTLPEADRALLEQGLPIDSLNELTERLEDYLS